MELGVVGGHVDCSGGFASTERFLESLETRKNHEQNGKT